MRRKTPAEEAAYIAGRQDAQLLCNLAFAGTNTRAPDLGDLKVATIAVPKASLLAVVRKLDFGATMTTQEFAAAFDDLRMAFTPNEIASGLRECSQANCTESALAKIEGDWLCHDHANEWSRGEGIAAAERENY
ncbi:hypothetical protein [Pseudophaeobacter sp.]|uniref:hypothetical protein n=1 Tax=Pseudophaeobacter sp. TaxID=1971739 RepID=UPI003299BCE6